MRGKDFVVNICLIAAGVWVVYVCLVWIMLSPPHEMDTCSWTLRGALL